MGYINYGTYGSTEFTRGKPDPDKICPGCGIREKRVNPSGRMRYRCAPCEKADRQRYKAAQKDKSKRAIA